MSVYAMANRLRDMRNYSSKRSSKYLDKLATLKLVNEEDISTIAYVLDSSNVPYESKQEVVIIKLYTKFLLDAAYYGLNVDATYWAYYNLLHRG